METTGRHCLGIWWHLQGHFWYRLVLYSLAMWLMVWNGALVRLAGSALKWYSKCHWRRRRMMRKWTRSKGWLSHHRSRSSKSHSNTSVFKSTAYIVRWEFGKFMTTLSMCKYFGMFVSSLMPTKERGKENEGREREKISTPLMQFQMYLFFIIEKSTQMYYTNKNWINQPAGTVNSVCLL